MDTNQKCETLIWNPKLVNLHFRGTALIEEKYYMDVNIPTLVKILALQASKINLILSRNSLDTSAAGYFAERGSGLINNGEDRGRNLDNFLT